MGYEEAIEYLYNARPPFHIVGGAAYKPGLDNIKALLAELGNPEVGMKCVHVAGTNGKGSTSHLIAAALQAAGYKVGLYTSPHLVDYRERVRVNGRLVEKEYVADWVSRWQAVLDRLQPSFFETTFGLAMSYMAEQKVDIAVIETGLGGRLDATNVITPIVSVITNIGMDHTEWLGNSLAKIAKEKAGIIKRGVPSVIGETDAQTMNVFIRAAQEAGIWGDGLETTNCKIWFADQCGYLRRCREREAPECGLKGNYQEKNVQTAYVTLRVISNLGFKISHLSIAEGFKRVCEMTGLRGRWEILGREPLVVCDTGHNAHGLRYVAQQLRELEAETVWVVFGMVNDKDTDVVMRLLPKGERYRYVFTTPRTKRARTAKEMVAMWREAAGDETGVMAIDDPKEAIGYAQAHAGAGDAIFIGGSNYLVGDAISCSTY